MRGRKSTNRIEYHGEKLSITEWISKLNLNLTSSCVYNRFFICGWSAEDSLETPSLPDRNFKKRIDRAVETVQEIMVARGYFRKETRVKTYKQLNGWYKEFRAEAMKAA